MGEAALASNERTVDARVHRVMVESAVNPFVLMESDGTIRWVGPAITEVLGHDPADMVGTNVLDWLDQPSQLVALSGLGDLTDFAGRDLSARWMGAGALFNVLTAEGTHVSCEATLATTARTGLDLHVLQIRRAAVQASIGEALRAMTELQSRAEVLELLCSMVELSVADSLVEIGHYHGADRPVSFDARVLSIAADARPDAADPWCEAARRGELLDTSLAELRPELRVDAAAAGFAGCWIQPVRSGVSDEIAAVVVVWHESDAPLTTHVRQTLERAAHLVSLTLQWDEGRNALAHAADHDSLTGLPNRRALFGHLEGCGSAGMVLYIDLDGFKAINDDHGHRFGDAVLAVVAERLRAAVRPTDFLARLGGDEFVVCASGGDVAAVSALAERLIATLSHPIRLDDIDTTVRIGASIGIAAGEPDRDPEVVLHAADVMLRRAKRSGKGRALADTAEAV